MGMRVSSGMSGASATGQSGAAEWQQRKQDYKSLASAMQSGNLDAAKSAYASMTSGSKFTTNNPNSPLAQLGNALQSGDMGAAQKAFAALQSAHHQRVSGRSGSASGVSPVPVTTPSPATATTGNNVNLVA